MLALAAVVIVRSVAPVTTSRIPVSSRFGIKPAAASATPKASAPPATSRGVGLERRVASTAPPTEPSATSAVSNP